MVYTTLIDTETLARHLDDRSFAIVDCRFKLDDPSWGEREYSRGHIPGAVYVHLDRDLSGPKTGSNGRHPLPDPTALAATLSRLGVDAGTQVVAYDQDVGMFASRLWWLVRWLGHRAVAVLDGGFTKWHAEGRPTAPGVESRAARAFAGAARHEMVVQAADVAEAASRPDWRIVDARAPERFRGDLEPIDKAAGHIPGAINHFFQQNVDERGVFLAEADLRTRLRNTVGQVAPEQIVCYCGSGVTACHNLLALEHVGIRGARLYPGSWSEWSSDRTRPIAKG